jgi:transcription initiation factor IIE alpha subunit
MGQEEVLKVLEKTNRPLTSKDIADLLDIGMRTVARIMSSLQKDKTIGLVARRLSMEEVVEYYGKKLNSPKIRFYYLEQKSVKTKK